MNIVKEKVLRKDELNGMIGLVAKSGVLEFSGGA